MKLQIGVIVKRSTGETKPIYREVTEEEHAQFIQGMADGLYDYVMEELYKRKKQKLLKEAK